VKWNLSCPKNCFQQYEQITVECPDGTTRTITICSGCKYQEYHILGYIIALEERVRKLEEQLRKVSQSTEKH